MIYVKQNNQKKLLSTIYVINQSIKKWFWDLEMNISRLLYIYIYIKPYTDQSKKHQSLWFITYVLYIIWKVKRFRQVNRVIYMVGSWEMRSDKSSKAPFEEKEEEASSVESDESFAEDLETPSTSSFVVQMRLPSWMLIFFLFVNDSYLIFLFQVLYQNEKNKKGLLNNDWEQRLEFLSRCLCFVVVNNKIKISLCIYSYACM